MFIKKLWYYNKKAAVVFVLFILSWCFINLKQGAVATPLLQYGMFSGPFYLNDTQNVLHIYANDQLIDFTKYSMSERDQLQSFLEYYLTHKNNNVMVYTTIKRILSKVYIGKFMKEETYTCNLSDEEFSKWYIKVVEKITHEKVFKLAAYYQKYTWQTGQLIAVSKPLKINCIVTN